MYCDRDCAPKVLRCGWGSTRRWEASCGEEAHVSNEWILSVSPLWTGSLETPSGDQQWAPDRMYEVICLQKNGPDIKI